MEKPEEYENWDGSGLATSDCSPALLEILLNEHLEGVGFLLAALDKAMSGSLTDDQKSRFRKEMIVMEERNIQIREEIRWTLDR